MTAALLALAVALPSSAAPERRIRTLVVCDDVQDPATLDPQKEFSEKNHTLVQQMYEGLVRFGPAGEIIPALATSWRRIDPLTMEFSLRRGVVFHDGEPFDAEAVRFSIERYLRPDTGFPALGFIDSLSRAEVLDAHTVRLVTRYPDGLLLNRLAGFVMVVPPRYVREKGEHALAERPVGTGPFRFVRWEKGNGVFLAANERYWNEGTPKVEALSFRFLPEEKQVDALLAGEIDVLTTLPGTRTLAVQRSSTAYVVKKPTFYTVAGNFNVARGPLANKRVREALNLAIDRKLLVRYDLLGNGVPIATLTLPGESGHNGNLPLYPYDPSRAKRILAEEGYGRGFKLNFLLKVNAARTGRIIAKQLEALGVKMEITPVTDAELFMKLRQREQWDVAMYDCPDPMHHAFFIRSIFLAGGSPFSLATVPGVDERIAAMVQELDPEKQRVASEELDAYIRNEHLALPTYQRVRTYGLRRGVEFTPYVSGMPYFHEAAVHE